MLYWFTVKDLTPREQLEYQRLNKEYCDTMDALPELELRYGMNSTEYFAAVRKSEDIWQQLKFSMGLATRAAAES